MNAIERSALLSHPTASRAKAPKRRPPSGINFKEVSTVRCFAEQLFQCFVKLTVMVGSGDKFVHSKCKILGRYCTDDD